MKNSQAKTTYLKHYKPPAFFIERTDLVFDLHEEMTIVTSELLFKKNKDLDDDALVLHGRDLVLESLFLNKFRLTPADYVEDNETLTIPNLSAILETDSDQFTMTCVPRRTCRWKAYISQTTSSVHSAKPKGLEKSRIIWIDLT